MSAVILAFPISSRPPRAAIETTIERLIDLLDAEDASTEDCEPEVDEDSDGIEVAALPERQSGIGTPQPLRLIFGGRLSADDP
jgi:hypothetical protein